ncbi:hypothetical protein [Herbaspirillum robiniae]|uniref:hypothetical protein n=1 Tax=Herbaspirillum robiniae TaxID=2014887 RepID=UPI00101AE735|nr:hypothetical protein [Herbaspirillum robiniae]
MPLTPPLRDDQGKVIPHDHPEILNDSGIIRRVHEEFVVTDPKARSGRRLSTSTLSASSGENGGMSVDLEQLILEAGQVPADYVTTPRWIASVRFQAHQLRAAGFQIGYDPVPESPTEQANPCHGQVWGNFTKGVQKRLLKQCDWLVPHEGADICCE